MKKYKWNIRCVLYLALYLIWKEVRKLNTHKNRQWKNINEISVVYYIFLTDIEQLPTKYKAKRLCKLRKIIRHSNQAWYSLLRRATDCELTFADGRGLTCDPKKTHQGLNDEERTSIRLDPCLRSWTSCAAKHSQFKVAEKHWLNRFPLFIMCVLHIKPPSCCILYYFASNTSIVINLKVDLGMEIVWRYYWNAL